MELTNVSSDLTFEQVVPYDGDRARNGIGRLFSRGPGACGSSAAAVAASKTPSPPRDCPN